MNRNPVHDKVCGRCGVRRGEHYIIRGSKALACERSEDNADSARFAWGGLYRKRDHGFFGRNFSDPNPNKAFRNKKGM